MAAPINILLALAHELGDVRRMAILGEGNVSARIDSEKFLVKASGTSLGGLMKEELVAVKMAPILAALGRADRLTDDEVTAVLMHARVGPRALKPSVETMFHAWLLTLPGVHFVGHVHATAVNQILCTDWAEVFATRPIFPDQVVCCGAEAVLVPYVDPGLALACAIRERVEEYRARLGILPKIILLKNHGIIAASATPRGVSSALAMAEKAATIFAGAVALGGPVYMPEEEVRRIASRTDEHYRQAMLTRN